MQRPSPRSYWKIPVLNKGISPVKAEDPEVDPMIARCVLEKKTLVATFVYDVLRFADVVIVDVQLDYAKNELGNVRNGQVEMSCPRRILRYHRPPHQTRLPGPHRDHRRPGHHRTGGAARR